MEVPEHRTETKDRRVAPNNPAISLNEKSRERIAENNKRLQNAIKEKEFRSEIRDFLKDTDLNLHLDFKEDLSRAEQVLFDHYFHFFQSVSEFSLAELNRSEVLTLLNTDNRELKAESIEETDMEFVSHAEQMRAFVDQLKSEGLPNTAIIGRILGAAESGELTVPQLKLIEYRNFLGLLNSDIPEKDKQVFSTILDSPSFDITESGAFERFARTALNTGKLSSKTVRFIAERYHFEPVVNGFDLRKNLHQRKKIRREIELRIGEHEREISSLEEEIEQLEKKVNEQKGQLRTTAISHEERIGIEHECEAL